MGARKRQGEISFSRLCMRVKVPRILRGDFGVGRAASLNVRTPRNAGKRDDSWSFQRIHAS
jgi:hypothetical protein